MTAPLSAAIQELCHDGCELNHLLGRQFAQDSASVTWNVFGGITMSLKYQMIEEALPNRPLLAR
jgi:hypothetical protein